MVEAGDISLGHRPEMSSSKEKTGVFKTKAEVIRVDEDLPYNPEGLLHLGNKYL